MRADLGRFADQCQIDIADPVARRCGKTNRVGQEPVRTGAFPLRIARWEVAADITRTNRAKDRVDQRMDRNIGIAVPGQALVMGDLDPAQPQRFAGGEAVDIIAGADPDHRGSVGEIAGESQLVQPLVSFNQCHLMPGSAGNLRIVTRLLRTVPGPVRRENGRIMKRLRGLDPAQVLAPGWGAHQRAISMSEAIDHRQNRDRAGGKF